jgi:alkanesulfonate monooxygenase
MSTEFFWRLPLGSDGPYLASDKNTRGPQPWKPGNIAPGRLPDGTADGFTYIDYIAQVAKAAEIAGFEGALLPTGPEPWIAAAALARETRRIKFLIAFQATWTLPAYAAQQAAILQSLSHDRLEWNIITGGVPAQQRANGDFLEHDLRYKRTGEWRAASGVAPGTSSGRVFLRLLGARARGSRPPRGCLSELGGTGRETEAAY